MSDQTLTTEVLLERLNAIKDGQDEIKHDLR